MKNTRPRTLRNRRPKQLDTRPLMEAARAGRDMADLMHEVAMATHRVDTHIRGAFLVGIAKGPNQLVMSEEAVMRIVWAFPEAGDDSPIVPGSTHRIPAYPWRGQGFGTKFPSPEMPK